jgi:hypothetical protein
MVGLLAAALLAGTVYILVRPADAQAGQGQGRAAEAGTRTGRRGGEEGLSGWSSDQDAYGRGADAAYAQGPRSGRAEDSDPGKGPRDGEPSTSGQGGYGRGQGAGADQGVGEPVEIGDWETVAGKAILADNEVIVQTAEGDVVIGLGQAAYREEAGFTLNTGDEVVVQGYYEDGEFKAGTVENLTTGQSIVLRDESGRPMWTGRGQR